MARVISVEQAQFLGQERDEVWFAEIGAGGTPTPEIRNDVAPCVAEISIACPTLEEQDHFERQLVVRYDV